jgi:signal transduction histidine kinase
MMSLGLNSVTRRLALAAALWVAVGLGLTGLHVSRILEEQIVEAADARIGGLMDAVVAATIFDPTAGPRLARAVSEPEFDRPLSGHYWQLTGPGDVVVTSRSLWDSRLPAASLTSEGPPVSRNVEGPRGEKLRMLERRVQIEGRRGAVVPVVVQVAVSREPVEEEITTLRRGLVLAFVGLGAGLVAVVALLVVWGLRPLRRTQEEIAEVRAGKREHMDVVAPAEIAPLVQEIEALIEQNRATVDRARTHVGNLAHALKTPIAVLRNALEAGDMLAARSQAQTLERLVQHHLRRARAGALAGSAGAESAPFAAAGALAAALRRLHAARGITIAVTGSEWVRVRADPQDLTEMLGNLMENACKYGRGRVQVRIASGAPGRAVIEVEDDGTGLAEGEDGAVLLRGVRLDEAKPGSGLGLAIVTDLADLYGGHLTLEPGQALGGLRARLDLPGRVVAEAPQAPSR